MTRSERFEFDNGRGQTLAGRLELPAGRARAVALFAHCFTCTKDLAAAARISRALAARDIAVLRFDFTGLGGSAGDFANTNFSSNVDDLVSAADALRTHHQAPKLLVGHSLGGAAVLAAARRIDEVEAVSTIGAPAEPAHVKHLLTGSIDEIEKARRRSSTTTAALATAACTPSRHRRVSFRAAPRAACWAFCRASSG